MQRFSADGENWHDNEHDDDIFVQYSFDGGNNWQIYSTIQNDTFILSGDESIFQEAQNTLITSSFLLIENNGGLGAILSAVISNNDSIPSAIYESSGGKDNIVYDFFSTRYYR